MKKSVLLIMLASVLATSCLKDGFNDFEALNHPMSFQGTVNPTLGVPIGSGSATIFDILKMVQVSYARMEVNEMGIITIAYDTTASWHLDIANSKKDHSQPKSSDIVHVARNSISGSVLIDLFDNIDILDNAELEVDSLKVFLGAYIKAQAREGALETMDSFHVHVYYDSLYINVVGQDDQLYSVLQINDSIPIDSLIEGEYIVLFNNTDISSHINKRPKEVRYGARMNIAFEAAFFASNITENEFVADSIGITSCDIDADIKVSFPVSAYISNLSYETDIEFSPSIELGNMAIDSSMIYIECINGIPLELLVQAKFVDENDNELCNIFGPEPDTIAVLPGALVALNPETNLYTAVTPSQNIIQVPITESVFNDLKKTKKIRLKAGLSSSDLNPPIQPRVAIRAEDKLNLRVWAKLKPSYNLDLGFGSEGDNGEGGAQ